MRVFGINENLAGHDLGRPVVTESTASANGWIVLFECTIAGALLYGLNLYFSTNGTINDPIVPVWWPLLKDAVFFFAFCVFLFGLRKHLSKPSPSLLLVIAFSVVTAILCFFFFGLSRSALAFSKNILLYFAGGAIIGTLIASVSSPSAISFRVSRAVLLSILVGFACLLLPVQSSDGRFYGTYGNPTSLGYAVFVALALSTTFGRSRDSIFFSILLGCVFVMTGSISVLLAGVVFIAIFASLEMFFKRPIKFQALLLAIIALSTLLSGELLRRVHGPAFGFERLADFKDTLHHSDSISTRLEAFVRPEQVTYYRYDSFLLGLYKNLGWAPLLIYACLIIALVTLWWRSARTREQNAIAACLFCLFVLDPSLQHQLEIFPTNFLFASFLGCAILWLGKSCVVSASIKPDVAGLKS
jgi:hypothetical protein